MSIETWAPAPLGLRARFGFVFILSSPGSTPNSAEIALFLCVFVMPACSLKLASFVNFAPVPGPDFPQSSVAVAAATVPVASSTSVGPARGAAARQLGWLGRSDRIGRPAENAADRTQRTARNLGLVRLPIHGRHHPIAGPHYRPCRPLIICHRAALTLHLSVQPLRLVLPVRLAGSEQDVVAPQPVLAGEFSLGSAIDSEAIDCPFGVLGGVLVVLSQDPFDSLDVLLDQVDQDRPGLLWLIGADQAAPPRPDFLDVALRAPLFPSR